MAESQTKIAARWRVEDLLDLDYFLSLDVDRDEVELISRDEKIARENLRPVLGDGAMAADASIAVRSQGLWLWLQQRREEEGESPLMPGQVFSQVCRLVKWLGGILMLILGAGLIFSLLHKEQQYFNVLMFLAATLLPQLILLLLLLLGGFFRRVSGHEAASGGVAQALIRSAMLWLSARVRKHQAGEQLQGQWQAVKQKTYLLGPVLALSQTMAIYYNLGMLAGFGLCLISMDVRFFWESTPGIAAVEGLEEIVRWVASPWRMWMADWLPGHDGIAATRITLEGAEKVFPASKVINSAAVWAPFLSAAVVFWGLLPRLLLRLGIGFWAGSLLRSYAFVERRHRELWRRLTALRIEVSNEGPDDEAVVLLWGGLNPDADELRKVLLQQLRLNPLQTFAAGNETDARADVERIEQVADTVAGMNAGVRLVVVVESWALAPREATDFLNQLRGLLGEQRAIRLLLLGPPESVQNFSEPSIAELKVWEDLVSERNDARLTVYPYRKSDG